MKQALPHQTAINIKPSAQVPVSPHTYSRRILLVVIGLTPQITTEVLYKLVVDSEPAFVPTEVHLVTTETGAESAKVALLGVPGSKGWFRLFCEDYDCHSITFSDSQIHVIEDTEGQFISDAESSQHNRIAADFITRLIQSMTADEGSALHVSLAGGRKTMSFYAGYALSLYGRMQDRLSHVLVNAPFMNHPDFFYPRPKAERLEVGNRYYSTDDARIILADIPYVRMRHYVPEQLLKGEAGFQETVEKIQRFAERDYLKIDTRLRTLDCNGILVKLAASDCALYTWLALRLLRSEGELCLDDDAFMDDYLAVYAELVGRHSGMYERAEEIALERNAKQQKNWFYQRKAKVNKQLVNALEARPATAFLIQMQEREGKAYYSLALQREQVQVLGVA